MPDRFGGGVPDGFPEWDAKDRELRRSIGTACLIALVGQRGTGKTQMAASVCLYAFTRAALNEPPEVSTYTGDHWQLHYERDKRIRSDTVWAARYTTVLDMFADIRMNNLASGESSAIAKWVRPGLLVIDEAQERGDTEFEQRVLTNLIDKRYGMMKDTIIISNLDPEALGKSLGPSIMSRMQETGKIIVCDWPSFRAKGNP